MRMIMTVLHIVLHTTKITIEGFTLHFLEPIAALRFVRLSVPRVRIA